MTTLMQKYTTPEQHIIYLRDEDLLKCLEEVLENDNKAVYCAIGKNVFNISSNISEQFGIGYESSLKFTKHNVYKESAKRWLKRMNNCCKNKSKKQ